MPHEDGIVIGLLAASDDRDEAETLAEDLPGALRERIGAHTMWRAEVCEAEPADTSASADELTAAVRRRLLQRRWQLGIGMTSLPLRVDRRPVAALASASHGVGLVSLPALGAVRRDDRLRDAAVGLVEGLLGEADGDGEGRNGRMRRRSSELASRAAGADSHTTLRFAGVVGRGNLRLLAGMTRANRPTRVMARLSRSATAALGAGAYALTSSSIWMVAHQSTWPRLVAVGLLSMTLILIALAIAHGLWERTADAVARERVVLFNIVTITTLAIGIAALYVALFAVREAAYRPRATATAGVPEPPSKADARRERPD